MKPPDSSALIQAEDLDEVRRLVAQGYDISQLPSPALTLSAAFELACAIAQWETTGNARSRNFGLSWARTSATALDACDRLIGLSDVLEDSPAGSTTSRPEAALELHSIRHANDVTSLQWRQYLRRFIHALQEHGGFGVTQAEGIAGALTEMAENVPRHSGDASHPSARGVVGFHVEPRTMTFAVADAGRGVLASLRSSSRWRNLENAQDALLQAVIHGASRIEDQARGDGFRTVLDALADLGGSLRFRSDDAVLLIDGRRGGSGIRQWTTSMPGLQLSVSCSLDGKSTTGAIP
jgi:anti-sigma regulatory factor (Ser/Thr protein kinase)